MKQNQGGKSVTIIVPDEDAALAVAHSPAVERCKFIWHIPNYISIKQAYRKNLEK